MDADPHGQAHTVVTRQGRVQGAHGLDQAQAGAHGPLGIVFMGLRIAKVHQQPVAEILRNIPVKALDHRGAGLLIRPHHIVPVFRVELPGQTGGIDQVTEQHRELTAFSLGQGQCASGRERRHGRLGRRVGGRDRVAAPATEARRGIVAGATLRTRTGQGLPARHAEQPGRQGGRLALRAPHHRVRRRGERGVGPRARQHRVVRRARRPGPCRTRGRRQDCYLGGEPVPVPPHGVEDGPWRPGITHGLPDLRQTIAQRVFLVALRRGPGPERLKQIALGHSLARMLHEIRQHPQGQGLQRHHLAPAAQLIALGIQLTLAKDIAHTAHSFGHSTAACVTRPAHLGPNATLSRLVRATGYRTAFPATPCSITEQL